MFTPGPNIILLTISGAKFGIRDTYPHLFGVVIGTGLLAAFSSLGVNTIILKAPLFESILKVISVSWIVYLALQLLTKENLDDGENKSRPFKFAEAVLFQLVNPKLWALTLSASAGFSIDGSIFLVLHIILYYFLWLIFWYALFGYFLEPTLPNI